MGDAGNSLVGEEERNANAGAGRGGEGDGEHGGGRPERDWTPICWCELALPRDSAGVLVSDTRDRELEQRG